MCDDLRQKIVIHTNMNRKGVEDISIKLGIRDYLDMIITPGDISNKFKPDIDAFEAVIDKVIATYSITPQDICYVVCKVTNLRLVMTLGCRTVLIKSTAIQNVNKEAMDKCNRVLDTFLDMDDIFSNKQKDIPAVQSEPADATIAQMQINIQSTIDNFSGAKEIFDKEAGTIKK